MKANLVGRVAGVITKGYEAKRNNGQRNSNRGTVVKGKATNETVKEQLEAEFDEILKKAQMKADRNKEVAKVLESAKVKEQARLEEVRKVAKLVKRCEAISKDVDDDIEMLSSLSEENANLFMRVLFEGNYDDTSFATPTYYRDRYIILLDKYLELMNSKGRK